MMRQSLLLKLRLPHLKGCERERRFRVWERCADSHAKLDNEEYTRVENLIEVLRSCPAVPLDATFPTYILQNQSHFRQIGFLD